MLPRNLNCQVPLTLVDLVECFKHYQKLYVSWIKAIFKCSHNTEYYLKDSEPQSDCVYFNFVWKCKKKECMTKQQTNTLVVYGSKLV